MGVRGVFHTWTAKLRIWQPKEGWSRMRIGAETFMHDQSNRPSQKTLITSRRPPPPREMICERRLENSLKSSSPHDYYKHVPHTLPPLIKPAPIPAKSSPENAHQTPPSPFQKSPQTPKPPNPPWLQPPKLMQPKKITGYKPTDGENRNAQALQQQSSPAPNPETPVGYVWSRRKGGSFVRRCEQKDRSRARRCEWVLVPTGWS